MNKKKTLLASLTILLLAGAVAPVLAAEPQGATSEVKVTFTPEDPTKPVDPLDPTDPTKPTDPTDPEEGTGNVGYLTLDYVPKLTFGNQKIARKPQSIQSTNTKAFVQVTDVRATGAGWNLQASMSDLVHDNGVNKINNAQLILKNPAVKTNDTKSNNAPTSSELITLTSNNTSGVDIFTAQEDHGMGTWLSTWLSDNSTNENVLLNLDTRDARAGGYTGTITWSLIQTP
ncbi:MAG: WxL domain-containing protein [Erysipelothrix sp.]